MLEVTTPTQITPLVKNFCASISKAEPVFVPVVDNMPAGYCYPNCKAKAEKEGGEIVFGRTIWVGEDLIEAEWHSVWRKDARLMDVTAKKDGETVILFLPTNEPWDGRTVYPNVRRVLADDPVLRQLVALQEKVERSARRLPDGRIEYDIAAIFQPPSPSGVRRNDPCPCGSGRKFKRCCMRG